MPARERVARASRCAPTRRRTPSRAPTSGRRRRSSARALMRPAPTRPNRPTISPARTWRSTPRDGRGRRRSRTSSTTGAFGASARRSGNSQSCARPDHAVTSSSTVASAAGNVRTSSPVAHDRDRRRGARAPPRGSARRRSPRCPRRAVERTIAVQPSRRPRAASEAVGSSMTITLASRRQRAQDLDLLLARHAAVAPTSAARSSSKPARSQQRLELASQPRAANAPETRRGRRPRKTFSTTVRSGARESSCCMIVMPARSASARCAEARGPAVNLDLPGVRPDDAAEDPAQRRLAGAVLADEALDLPRRHRDPDVVESPVAAEGLHHPARSQDRGRVVHHASAHVSAWISRPTARRPPGAL